MDAATSGGGSNSNGCCDNNSDHESHSDPCHVIVIASPTVRTVIEVSVMSVEHR